MYYLGLVHGLTRLKLVSGHNTCTHAYLYTAAFISARTYTRRILIQKTLSNWNLCTCYTLHAHNSNTAALSRPSFLFIATLVVVTRGVGERRELPSVGVTGRAGCR